jgi:predicted nucleic acid-binding Zn ribbon protein
MISETPQALGSVLNALLRQLGIKAKVEQYGIFELWNELVGEQIARVSNVEKVENGILFVRVTAAPWRTELTFQKKEILEKIHAATHSNAIKDIRFR